MKKFLGLMLMAGALSFGMEASAQKDKSARKSLPAEVSSVLEKGGAAIKINYSRPSVKGRTIGEDLEPMRGKIWRTGANEATTFETDKAVLINGEPLPAGKYSLFTIYDGNTATLIFNKKSDQWGAYAYDQADDALRVTTKVFTEPTSTEMLTITMDEKGEGAILWGNTRLSFKVDPPRS